MRNKMAQASKIKVQGLDVGLSAKEYGDYINLTDIARWKNPTLPAQIVMNWLRNADTIDFIGLWEKLNNPNFNLVEFDEIKSRYGRNAFVISPSQWVEKTDAIGIIAGRGKYSEGTFAHSDIALEFLSWISTEFKLYFIYEFKRLKTEEQKAIGWSAKRELAKINYRIQTDSIQENLIPKDLNENECSYIYANEADRINKALFSKTAAEWKAENKDKDGNIRDYASVEQLLVLANLESLNAEFIRMELLPTERTKRLNEAAIKQMKSLLDNGDAAKLNKWTEQRLLHTPNLKKKSEK
jgi:hypothetical protein